MLLPLLDVLNSKNIVLVSTSPRRKSALRQLGLNFQDVPSTFAEDLDVTRFPTPADYVKETALEKSSLFQREGNLTKPLDLVIAADTVAVFNGEVLGKPKTKDEARRMLQMLSGQTHTVITGVALVVYERKKDTKTKIHERIFHEETEVTFATLPSEFIEMYVKLKEPMDKAGAYAIQGIAGSFIEGIKGDYYNVVGFPLHHFSKKIIELHNENLL